MEVCGEGETAVSQGGGDAPLGHKQVSWEEQVQVEERGPKTTLGGNCLHHHHEAQHLLLHFIWAPLPVMMGS